MKNSGDFSHFMLQTCSKISLELGSKDSSWHWCMISVFNIAILILKPSWEVRKQQRRCVLLCVI